MVANTYITPTHILSGTADEATMEVYNGMEETDSTASPYIMHESLMCVQEKTIV